MNYVPGMHVIAISKEKCLSYMAVDFLAGVSSRQVFLKNPWSFQSLVGPSQTAHWTDASLFIFNVAVVTNQMVTVRSGRLKRRVCAVLTLDKRIP